MTITSATSVSPPKSKEPKSSPASPPLLEIHPSDFELKFSREPFLIRHGLAGHPLFTVERILELAKSLPQKSIEYNAGNLPMMMDPSLTPRNGLSAQETIRRIADCESWMVLKYIEQDPDYRQLLDKCLDIIRPYSEPIAPGMMQPQAFIFLTSPRSVTPFHIDPEHNFLLQIQGTKEIHLLDGRDREILSEFDLEQFYADRGRNLRVCEERLKSGWEFQLKPGEGLYFPVTYPHWVQNGEDVSISFSITFRTPDLDRRRAVYRINERLRRMGLKPAPVGRRPVRDWLLFNAYRVGRKLFG